MNKVFSSPQEYQEYNRRRAEAIKKNLSKTAINAAKFMAAKARAYAPMKSRRLVRGIIRRKNVVTARASNKGFPYIHWINQTPGTNMTTIHLKRNRITGQFSKLAELSPGDGPIFAATYGLQPSWNWSGKAMFFQKAFGESRKHYNIGLQRARKKSLQAEFI
jgi:hypothetical protein